MVGRGAERSNPQGDALHRVVDGPRGAGTGDGEPPTVVLVHGFTQTLASWGEVAARLADRYRVVRVDAPGHGGSATVRADLVAGARLVGDAGGRAVYVGYSMGGRLALRLAIDRPDLVRGLVLVGATAGIDDPAERAGRRASDDALAARIEREGVEAFLEGWLAQPLFAGLTPSAADLAARRANTAAGLASSLRLAGTGTMDPPWWPELEQVRSPTLVVAGGADAKFTDLGRRLVAGIGPAARLAVVPGAGHAVHLERPDAVLDELERFLAALPAVGP